MPPGETQAVKLCCIMHQKTQLNHQHGDGMFLLDPGRPPSRPVTWDNYFDSPLRMQHQEMKLWAQQSENISMGILLLKCNRRWDFYGRSMGAESQQRAHVRCSWNIRAGLSGINIRKSRQFRFSKHTTMYLKIPSLPCITPKFLTCLILMWRCALWVGIQVCDHSEINKNSSVLSGVPLEPAFLCQVHSLESHLLFSSYKRAPKWSV
jgi:hypothetical protein